MVLRSSELESTVLVYLDIIATSDDLVRLLISDLSVDMVLRRLEISAEYVSTA